MLWKLSRILHRGHGRLLKLPRLSVIGLRWPIRWYGGFDCTYWGPDLTSEQVNCLHEIFFDAAIADAKALDEYFEENDGKPKGPLHGLPVSLKDQFHVKGVETTMGYVGVGRSF